MSHSDPHRERFHTSFLVMVCDVVASLMGVIVLKSLTTAGINFRSEACYIDHKIQCMDTLHLSVQPDSFPSSLEQLGRFFEKNQVQKYLVLKGYIQKPLLVYDDYTVPRL